METVGCPKGKHNSPLTEFKKGERVSIETEFKKGNIPYNKGIGITRICPTCNKQFKKKNPKIIHCSRDCMNANPEYREKQRLSLIGRVMPFRGKPAPYRRGANNWQYKGGVTSPNRKLRTDYRWEIWRTEVFERDEFTCQECHIKGNFLHPHHIISVENCLETNREYLVFEISNGITLCKDCHMELHGLFIKKEEI